MNRMHELQGNNSDFVKLFQYQKRLNFGGSGSRYRVQGTGFKAKSVKYWIPEPCPLHPVP